MPAPIDRIGAKVVTPPTDAKPASTSGAKFREALKQEPAQETAAADQKTIERDLRKRIERTGTQDPQKLFGADLKDLRTRIESAKRADAPAGMKDRLTEIEAQYANAEDMLKRIPDTNNLRDLLSMQTEMYKMSHNLELLSKVVDAATSGVKQTLQTQV
jgi:hypothetical protein